MEHGTVEYLLTRLRMLQCLILALFLCQNLRIVGVSLPRYGLNALKNEK